MIDHCVSPVSCAAGRGKVRMPKPERHVLVCLNTRPAGNARGSCGQRGSEEVFTRLKAMVAERGLDRRIMVSRTGCLKHCSHGTTMAVYPENVWYAGVTLQDLDEIVTSHLVAGRAVERLLMPNIPWE
jgi:(2Fe-2S) ferredoxin